MIELNMNKLLNLSINLIPTNFLFDVLFNGNISRATASFTSIVNVTEHTLYFPSVSYQTSKVILKTRSKA